MYQLAIADDEYTIRTGLSTAVDWRRLGFEVCALCEDGDELLSYARGHRVDAVLTDIRMSRTGGLDVAEYFRREFPDAVVLFISGYREFELAKRAMELGVARYILKPISLDELRRTFSEVKEQLDRRALARALEGKRARALRSMAQAARAMWVEELYFGLAGDEAYVRRKEAEFFAPNTRACLLEVDLGGMEALKRRWRYGAETLNEALHVALEGSGECEFFRVARRYVCAARTDDAGFRALFAEATDRLRDAFRLSPRLRPLSYFNALAELSGVGCEQAVDESPDEAADIEKLLSARALLGDEDSARALIGGLVRRFEPLPLPARSARISEMLAAAGAKDAGEVGKAQSAGELYRAADQCARTLAHAGGDAPPNDLVARAQAYVDAHYPEDISLSAVADAIFVNRNYLCGIFKEKTGVGFQTYLTDLRIQKAAARLAAGERISSAARTCGYPDASYFARVFRERMGVTPSEYARTAKRIEN